MKTGLFFVYAFAGVWTVHAAQQGTMANGEYVMAVRCRICVPKMRQTRNSFFVIYYP